ncbi:hypothetical protein LX36DRAFT_654995 [Colletotrichum falcatum]|nr:hypothetical protein LX36DRAFT_654995 [Colletotrichum falcatum]
MVRLACVCVCVCVDVICVHPVTAQARRSGSVAESVWFLPHVSVVRTPGPSALSQGGLLLVFVVFRMVDRDEVYL